MEMTCPGCGAPLPESQCGILSGGGEGRDYNAWFLTGYCSFLCWSAQGRPAEPRMVAFQERTAPDSEPSPARHPLLQAPSVCLTEEGPEVEGRPPAITVLCLLGLVGVLLSSFFILTASPDVETGVVQALFIALGAILLVGMWHMKRWAAKSYVYLLATNQVLLFLLGKLDYVSLQIQIVIVFFIALNARKFR